LNASLLHTATPRLIWNAVSGATGYRIQVASNLSLPIRSGQPLTSTSYTINPALPMVCTIGGYSA